MDHEVNLKAQTKKSSKKVINELQVTDSRIIVLQRPLMARLKHSGDPLPPSSKS